MAKYETLGQYLVHSTLPSGFEFDNPTVDKKTMSKGLINLAKSSPDKYVDAVTKLKQIGDEVATLEGISVGLDDIEPDYKNRDAVLKKYFTKIKGITAPKERRKLLFKAQDELLGVTKNHHGDMALQAKSGGRGNIPQLMKTVTTPLMAQDWDGNVIPWMVGRSYAEGLRPSELWVTAGEARKNAIMGVTAVVEPGELSKLVVHTMYDQVVSTDDCGTKNGIRMDPCDADVLDRYTAGPNGSVPHNTLITPQVSDALCKKMDKVLVRSPMTCEAHDGVCTKCYGLNTQGNPVKLGTNVGVQSGHALSEPLTQAMLSSKHAAGVAQSDTKELRGFHGAQMLMKIPQTFANAAILAKHHGKVTNIKPAPQGGTFVYVDDTSHYLSPDLDASVRVGQRVEAGDTLSTGIPRPNEIMKHKGIGVGRQYYTDALNKVFKSSIGNIDRRHFEMLAKSQLTHAKVEDDPEDDLLRGDQVNYNRLRERLQKKTTTIPVTQSVNKTLAKNYHEYLAGTVVTENVKKELKQRGINEVEVAVNPPKISFFMKPITHTPLLNQDWMSMLSHQYLSKTIKDGAAFNWSSDVHSYHPIPAFVQGTEFGAGSSGAY